METIGKIVTFTISLLVSIIVAGWAIAKLWGWFIVPLGVTEITMMHGIGIRASMSALRGYGRESKEPEDEKPAWYRALERTGKLVAWSLMLVLIGWIVSRWI